MYVCVVGVCMCVCVRVCVSVFVSVLCIIQSAYIHTYLCVLMPKFVSVCGG